MTTDCDLRCRYCYASGGERPERMEWRVAKRALDTVAALGLPSKIQFAGGEPLLELGLVERVVAYTRGWGVGYQIQTNATHVDAAVARRLRRLGLAVGVSLDGPPAVNDALRPGADGSGSTLKTVAGIEQLRRAGIRVGLTAVVSRENVASLPDLVTLASYLGNVDGISLDVLRPSGRALTGAVAAADPAAAASATRQALRRASELTAAGGAEVRFREVERMRRLLAAGRRRAHRCYFDARRSLVVLPSGDAYPCASLAGSPAFFLGAVEDAAFASRVARRLGEARGECRAWSRCGACPALSLCGGPCPAQIHASHLAGRAPTTECAVRGAYFDHVVHEGSREHATRAVCLPV